MLLLLSLFFVCLSVDILWVKPNVPSGRSCAIGNACNINDAFKLMAKEGSYKMYLSNGTYLIQSTFPLPKGLEMEGIKENSDDVVIIPRSDQDGEYAIMFQIVENYCEFSMKNIKFYYNGSVDKVYHFMSTETNLKNTTLTLDNVELDGLYGSFFDDSAYSFSHLYFNKVYVHNSFEPIFISNKKYAEVRIVDSKFSLNIRCAFRFVNTDITIVDVLGSFFSNNSNIIHNTDDEFLAYGGGMQITTEVVDRQAEISLIVRLKDTKFYDNEAIKGGGAFFMSFFTGSITTEMINVKAKRNSAHYLGGGFYFHSPFHDFARFFVDMSTFEDNVSIENGGALFLFFTLGTINQNLVNSKFIGNSAYKDGGGYYGLVSSGDILSKTINCTFDGNSAVLRGGGMYLESCSRNVTNLIIKSLFSNNDGFFGGGFAVLSSNLHQEITYSTFGYNLAFLGAGGFLFGSDLFFTLDDSDLVYNSASNNGGGLFLSGRTVVVKLRKSSFFQNSGVTGAGVYILANEGLLQAEVDTCIFELNSGHNGIGAALFHFSSDVTVSVSHSQFNDSIWENPNQDGGAFSILPFSSSSTYGGYRDANGHDFSTLIFPSERFLPQEDENYKRRFFSPSSSSSHQNTIIGGNVNIYDNIFSGNMGSKGASIWVEVPNLKVDMNNNFFTQNQGNGANVKFKNTIEVTLKDNVYLGNRNNYPAAQISSSAGSNILIEDKSVTTTPPMAELEYAYALDGAANNLKISKVKFLSIYCSAIQIETAVTLAVVDVDIVNGIKEKRSDIDGNDCYFSFSEAVGKMNVSGTVTTSTNTCVMNSEANDLILVDFQVRPGKPDTPISLLCGDSFRVENSVFENSLIFVQNCGTYGMTVVKTQFNEGSHVTVSDITARIVLGEDGSQDSQVKFSEGMGLTLLKFESFIAYDLSMNSNSKQHGGGIFAHFDSGTRLFRIVNSGMTWMTDNSAELGGMFYFEGNNENAVIEFLKSQPSDDYPLASLNEADYGSAFFIDLASYNFSLECTVEYNRARFVGASFFGQTYSRAIPSGRLFPRLGTNYEAQGSHATSGGSCVSSSPVRIRAMSKTGECKYTSKNIYAFECIVDGIELEDSEGKKVDFYAPYFTRFSVCNQTGCDDGVKFPFEGKSEIHFDAEFVEKPESIPKTRDIIVKLFGFRDTYLEQKKVTLKFKKCPCVSSSGDQCMASNWVSCNYWVLILIGVILGFCFCFSCFCSVCVFSVVSGCLFFIWCGLSCVTIRDIVDVYFNAEDDGKIMENKTFFETWTIPFVYCFFCLLCFRNKRVFISRGRRKMEGSRSYLEDNDSYSRIGDQERLDHDDYAVQSEEESSINIEETSIIE